MVLKVLFALCMSASYVPTSVSEVFTRMNLLEKFSRITRSKLCMLVPFTSHVMAVYPVASISKTIWLGGETTINSGVSCVNVGGPVPAKEKSMGVHIYLSTTFCCKYMNQLQLTTGTTVLSSKIPRSYNTGPSTAVYERRPQHKHRSCVVFCTLLSVVAYKICSPLKDTNKLFGNAVYL